MQALALFMLISAVLMAGTTLLAQQPASPRGGKAAGVLGFTAKDIDGKQVDLSRYQGKVLLIVNTASKCGHTPQYAQLEKLHETYRDKGLAVLGFPCNQFGGQEPGSEAQIKEFCSSNYDVKFDLFSKVAVKGENQHPLYKYLTSPETNGDFAGEIKWNFTKFLVSRDGKVVARFEPKVKPDDKQVTDAIEAELARAK